MKMALNNRVVSTIVFFLILSIFRGEATTANPPEKQKTTPKVSPAPSPTSPDCATEYIKFHLNGTTAKTKEFLGDNIEKRLHDQTFGESDKECLMRCFQAYHAAIASIQKAAADVSKNKFSNAIIEVVAYSSFIGSSMKLKCSSNIILQNPEFAGMQKWAESSAYDLLKKLKICTQ